jgi:magnesium chelatase subunit D
MQAAQDALLAAACLSVDPSGLGGILVRTHRDQVSELWVERLQSALGSAISLRRLPGNIDDERLLGGLDTAASLRTGRVCEIPGLLSEAHGAVLIAGLTERMAPRLAAMLTTAMDTGEVSGVHAPWGARAARFGIVALDSGQDEQERTPPALVERLALCIDLRQISPRDLSDAPSAFADLDRARGQLCSVGISEDAVRTLCVVALQFGIGSLRSVTLAIHAARACAALRNKSQVEEDELAAAVRLVLAPRACSLPEPAPAEQTAGDPQEQPDTPDQQPAGDAHEQTDRPPDQQPDAAAQATRVAEAMRAAIPADLLAKLSDSTTAHARDLAGRMGGSKIGRSRGRPIGTRAGSPGRGARLHVLATLRAAAPWQRLRRAQARTERAVWIRAEDFRIACFKERTQTATVFVLDASGSSALHRLAECKGAVELLLAQCYVRRDQVAVITFRGSSAELVVPPTRSLLRARRSLAGMPGGGTTPLAHGLKMGGELAESLRRRGFAPLLVLLTDGNANVALDGMGGRAGAQRDALTVAARLRGKALQMLLIDSAPRPQQQARLLADALQARYLPLPYADARSLLSAVRAAG